MPFEIAVVGSCNLDLVVPVRQIPKVGETILGGDLERIAGGKGANQAVAASRLGNSVAMIGRVGDDDAGIFLRGGMEANGVNTEFLFQTSGVPSGVALIAVQNDGDNTIVVSPGANSRLSPEDIIDSLPIDEAKIVLLQAEIPMETILAAARTATGTIIWNPAPAPTETIPLELLDLVDVLVLNQTELALLSGIETIDNMEKAVEAAKTLPCSSKIVTLGEQGALVISSNDAVVIPAPQITPVDTTAAGDAFCAALAGSLVEKNDLVAAAQWAVNVGAATALVSGAQPSLPTSAEVWERLKNR